MDYNNIKHKNVHYGTNFNTRNTQKRPRLKSVVESTAHEKERVRGAKWRSTVVEGQHCPSPERPGRICSIIPISPI